MKVSATTAALACGLLAAAAFTAPCLALRAAGNRASPVIGDPEAR